MVKVVVYPDNSLQDSWKKIVSAIKDFCVSCKTSKVCRRVKKTLLIMLGILMVVFTILAAIL